MLALIAGTGALPAEVYQTLAARNAAPLVCAMEGFAPDIPGVAMQMFRLETLGTLLADLSEKGVTQVCLVGAIRRPVFDPAALDAATRPLVPVLQAALGSGDDGALRAVIGLFETAGFTVVGVDVLLPDLLPCAGIPSVATPSTAAKADARRADGVIQALAKADLGQACVVTQGQVMAVEATPGTDWMLASLRSAEVDLALTEKLGTYAAFASVPNPVPERGEMPENLAKGGILYKAPKPGQDRRVDLPTIGPQTMIGAALAGLDGVVIEAGGVMVVSRDEVLDIAKATGLFLWVRPAGENV